MWILIISVVMCISNLSCLRDIANLFFLRKAILSINFLIRPIFFYHFIVDFYHVDIHTVYNTSQLIKHHMNCFYLRESMGSSSREIISRSTDFQSAYYSVAVLAVDWAILWTTENTACSMSTMSCLSWLWI